MADIKLVYFSLRGRAEPLRLTMVAAGNKFEDYKFGMEQLAAEKESKLQKRLLPLIPLSHSLFTLFL